MTVHSADVVVVGGGFAGAIAARDLRGQGLSVVLLEARDRLGGRTWYRPFASTQQSVEFGGGWISARTMPDAANEIQRYGLRLEGRPALSVDFSWRALSGLRTGFPLVGSEIYEFERVAFDLLVAAHRIDPEIPRDLQDLHDLDVSVAEYFARFRLSPEVSAFVDTWARIGSGAESSEWSALQLVSTITAFGNSVWGYLAEVSEHLTGGTSSLLSAIIEDNSPEAHLSSPVIDVRQSAEDVLVTSSDGRLYNASAAVIATPVNTWPDIEFTPALDGEIGALAKTGHRGRMQKFWVQVENVPPNVMVTGADSRFLIISSEYAVDDTVLLVAFVAPPQELDASSIEAVRSAVHELLPRAEVVAIDSHDWRNDPYAKGTWRVARPGELSTAQSELTKPQGRVVFAGADLATRWTGWVDGAIETGKKAAAAAAEIVQQPTARNSLA